MHNRRSSMLPCKEKTITSKLAYAAITFKQGDECTARPKADLVSGLDVVPAT